MKNMSRTDFCSRLSKKIAGAQSASPSPAARPARFANTPPSPSEVVAESRVAAMPSNTHDVDPISAWMIRTASRSRSKIA